MFGRGLDESRSSPPARAFKSRFVRCGSNDCGPLSPGCCLPRPLPRRSNPPSHSRLVFLTRPGARHSLTQTMSQKNSSHFVAVTERSIKPHGEGYEEKEDVKYVAVECCYKSGMLAGFLLHKGSVFLPHPRLHEWINKVK